MVESEKKKIEAKLKEVKERVKREEESGGDNLEELKKSLGDIEKQAVHARKKEEEDAEERGHFVLGRIQQNDRQHRK